MTYEEDKNDLTIVINTCDAYSDVLKIFFHAMREYWSNCPYLIVINTENSTYDYPAIVHNYSNGLMVDDWGRRLQSTLASINTEFVLMVYDDFILNQSVNNKLIQAALQKLRLQPKIAVAYLINTSLPLVNENSPDLFIKVKDKVDYRLNSAPGIWRKQELLNYTSAGDTPWAWEAFGTYRTWGDGKIFYSLNPTKPDIYPYDYSKGGAIYRGKWVREVVEQVAQKYQLEIDWNQRGYSSELEFEKRSIKWKIRFMETGFRMVGLKALYFIASYIRSKIYAS
jgi:hypothetical protein